MPEDRRARVIAAIADDFTQLLFHVYAHLPLDGPGSIADRRYQDWAAPLEPERDVLVNDAAVLARLWNLDPRLDALHRVCDLHRGLTDFLVGAGRSLRALEPADVADPPLLTQLQALAAASPAVELLRATLALLAPGYAGILAATEAALHDARVAIVPWLTRLAPFVPGLTRHRVELVWALGMHGRALPARILVGAPSAWSGCTPARQAVLAAHEAMTITADGAHRDDIETEWAALTGLAQALREADPELRAVHRDWLRSLDLSPLLAEAKARGWSDGSLTAALLQP